MLRVGLDISNDFISRVNRRTNEFVTNVYDDIDAVIPDWADNTEKMSPPEQISDKKYNVKKTYPPYFNNKSILLNTVYPDYKYSDYHIYKY